MTWDASKPADDEKLRDLGTVIRPNWEAIEEGESSLRPYAINFIDRTAESVTPVTPAAIANAMIEFCKQDTAGNQQLWAIDENSTVKQITDTPSSSSGQYTTTTPFGMIFKWGSVNTSASTTNSITYPTAFPNNCFAAVPFVTGLIQTVNPWRVNEPQFPKTGFTIISSQNMTPGTNYITYFAIGN